MGVIQGMKILTIKLTIQELYAKHGLHPLSSLKYTLPQAPIYVLLFFSVRDMCFDPVFSQSMAFGGTLWFTDLTAVYLDY